MIKSKQIEALHKDKIIALYAADKRPKQIAHAIGVDAKHVIYLLQKWKLYKRRSRTTEQVQKLVEDIAKLLFKGFTKPEAAKKLGMKRQAIYFYCHKYKSEMEAICSEMK